MLRVLTMGPLLALGLAGLAPAQVLRPSEPPGPHGESLATPDFLLLALQAGEFQVEEGQLASMRALRPAVRALAGEMVRAHSRNDRQLRQAALRTGLPSPPAPGLDLGQQQQFEQLKATTGPAFDRIYVDQQVRAHLHSLSLMNSYIQNGPPGALRQAALHTRPMVSRHLAQLERLQSGMR